jgi:hypothetical protein
MPFKKQVRDSKGMIAAPRRTLSGERIINDLQEKTIDLSKLSTRQLYALCQLHDEHEKLTWDEKIEAVAKILNNDSVEPITGMTIGDSGETLAEIKAPTWFGGSGGHEWILTFIFTAVGTLFLFQAQEMIDF